MTYTSARSLIAGLGFTLVEASAVAQTSVPLQGAGLHGGMHHQHQAAATVSAHSGASIPAAAISIDTMV